MGQRSTVRRGGSKKGKRRKRSWLTRPKSSCKRSRLLYMRFLRPRAERRGTHTGIYLFYLFIDFAHLFCFFLGVFLGLAERLCFYSCLVGSDEDKSEGALACYICKENKKKLLMKSILQAK